MLLPIAVRRPVVRLATASSKASVSDVGAWTSWPNPANATTPIWVVASWRWMKSAAARLAACRRLGAMSVKHMLRETSIARMIEVWPEGADDGDRPGEATTNEASPEDEQANGQVAPETDDPGDAASTSDRLEKRTAPRLPPAPEDHQSDDEGRKRQEERERAPARAGSWRPPIRQPIQAGHGVRPSHRTEASPPSARDQDARPGEQRCHLHRLGSDDEPGIERVVHLAQVGLVGGAEARPRRSGAMAFRLASSSWVWTVNPSS